MSDKPDRREFLLKVGTGAGIAALGSPSASSPTAVFLSVGRAFPPSFDPVLNEEQGICLEEKVSF